MEVGGRQVGESFDFAVLDDLFDDSVVAVFTLGLERGGGVVGEEGVVAPDGEQLALFADSGGFRQVADAAHNETFFFRLSAWSLLSGMTAPPGGARYRPMTSVAFSANAESVEILKVPERCGFRFPLRQMRAT